ncbi:ENHANCED DISEASE RESISTANCE 2 [Spatholobus suberectus]|nr:ENHANCED DISEASE RESISTANCE 2 [Spatholobus suberectus]
MSLSPSFNLSLLTYPSSLHVKWSSFSSAHCADKASTNVPAAEPTPEICYRRRHHSDWISDSINGGSLRRVDLHAGTNGWASPPGDVFSLRSATYLTNRQKSPAGDYLLSPAGMDWLKSATKIDHALSRADNRVMHALRRSQQTLGQSLKSFVLAVNLQIPGAREHHSAVFYFATDEPVRTGSLLNRFVNGDDAFRNQRFKLVNRIVRGPWIVKKAVGNHSACLLGKALNCTYHKGSNYLEIDVDIGSSAIANAILHLALGYVTAVTIDMGFVVEAQTEEELPERLIGAVRVCQMEMSSATVVEVPHVSRGVGLARVNHHESEDELAVDE